MTADRHNLTRRGFCLCCTAAALQGWLSPREAWAEARGLVTLIKDSAATSPITVHRLRGGIAVLEGSGGNIAALPGPDGTVMVDAGIGVSQPQITRALAGLSAGPITHLINTHWHFDHADGNAWIGAAGAEIIAHPNTAVYLGQAVRVEDWDYNFLPSPAKAIPTRVPTGGGTLTVNGATLALAAYAPAHTDSDLSVTVAEADVIHAGDTFWNGIYPFIDYSTGGSIDGMISACDATLAAAGPDTIIIPGHGQPVSNRAELQDFRDMLAAIRENVADLKGQGMSLAETVAAKPTEAYDARYGTFVIDPAFFTRLVYEGV